MKWILMMLVALSLLLSIIACISVHNKYNIDVYSCVVAILTLLVTTLIAWQIYNAIEFNKKLNEMQRIASKAAYEENKKYNHTTMAVIHYMNAIDYYKRQNISEKTVDELFCCIEEALKGRFLFPIDLAIDFLLNIPKDNLFIEKTKKESYLRTLYKINRDDINLVITKIEEAYG